MQTPAPVDYAKATSVDHAIGLLEQHGEEARLIAGGHSLIPMMRLRLARPEFLIDINDLGDLKGISVQGDEIVIGAMVRHAEVLASPILSEHYPIFAEARRSSPIRSCATGERSVGRCVKPTRPRTCRRWARRSRARWSSGVPVENARSRFGSCITAPTRRRSDQPRSSLRCASRSDLGQAVPTRRSSGGSVTGRSRQPGPTSSSPTAR